MEELSEKVKRVAPLLLAAQDNTNQFINWQKANPAFARELIKVQVWLDGAFRLRAHALLALRDVSSRANPFMAGGQFMDESELVELYSERWMDALRLLPNSNILEQLLTTDKHLRKCLQEKVIPSLETLVNSFVNENNTATGTLQELAPRLHKAVQDVCAYERNLFANLEVDHQKIGIIENFYQTLISGINLQCKRTELAIKELQDELMVLVDKQVRAEQQQEHANEESNKYALHLGITMKNVILMLIASSTQFKDKLPASRAKETPRADKTYSKIFERLEEGQRA